MYNTNHYFVSVEKAQVLLLQYNNKAENTWIRYYIDLKADLVSIVSNIGIRYLQINRRDGPSLMEILSKITLEDFADGLVNDESEVNHEAIEDNLFRLLDKAGEGQPIPPECTVRIIAACHSQLDQNTFREQIQQIFRVYNIPLSSEEFTQAFNCYYPTDILTFSMVFITEIQPICAEIAKLEQSSSSDLIDKYMSLTNQTKRST